MYLSVYFIYTSWIFMSWGDSIIISISEILSMYGMLNLYTIDSWYIAFQYDTILHTAQRSHFWVRRRTHGHSIRAMGTLDTSYGDTPYEIGRVFRDFLGGKRPWDIIKTALYHVRFDDITWLCKLKWLLQQIVFILFMRTEYSIFCDTHVCR